MNSIDIKKLLDAGLSPREIHEASLAAHHAKIDAEIAAGQWRRPRIPPRVGRTCWASYGVAPSENPR